MAIETTTTLSGNIHSYYHKRLLMSAEKMLRLRQLGKDLTQPRRSGENSFVLRYGNVAASTNELSEGVTPSETTIDTNKYTVEVKQYGQFIKVSDFLITTAIDPVLENVSDRLGYAAALSMDSIIRNELVTNATNNTQYVGSGNSADDDISASEIFTARDVLKGVRILRGTDAPTFEDGLYRWVIHPYNGVDIMSDTAAGGFIELNKYVQGLAEGPLKGEIGKVYGARVIESSNISSEDNSGSVAVYRTLLLAKDAFCVSSFDKNAIKLIVKQAGSAGTADPLEQLATAGYKMEFGVEYVGGSFSGDNDASPDLCLQIRGSATT